ncbi:MAG: DUF3373 family protein [Acidobacteriota bacterium]
MRKFILAGLMAALLLPVGLMAQSNEDLMKQIEALKQQLQSLEAKVAAQEKVVAQEQAAPAPAPGLEKEVSNLDARLSKVEVKTGSDRINWGGDLRVGYGYQNWHIAPYQQFTGFNPQTHMPMFQQVPGQDWNNSMDWSLRMRLTMNAQVNDNLKFMGRLSMYQLYGGADVPIFNGSPNTVLDSFNSAKIPNSDVLHVERALMVYRFTNIPFSFAIGRMNTSDGPPLEIRDESERDGTPMAIMVNAEVDGIHAEYGLHGLGLPDGTTIGMCAGIGYESGFGGGGQTAESYTMTPFGVARINGMRDTKVVGLIYDMPLMWMAGNTVNSAEFILGYNRFNDMMDIPYGALLNFPIPGPYAQSSPQYVTATRNLGDMDQYGLTWEHHIGDNFVYFVSGGYIKSHPNGQVSQYGFGGLLGDPNHSQTGSAYYTGVRWKATPKWTLGAEFNHGSKRWYTFTPSAGEPSDKLAARGDVWEGYVHWNFNKNVMLKMGYIHYDYSTAYSGWQIAPANLDYFNLNNNPQLFYPFPKTVKNAYVMLEARF